MKNKYISGHYAKGNKPDRERQSQILLIHDIKKNQTHRNRVKKCFPGVRSGEGLIKGNKLSALKCFGAEDLM